MKRFILSSLMIGLFLVAFSSCDKKISQSASVNGATSKYFPEPCLNWGATAVTIKSQMISIGYTFSESHSEHDFEYMDFTYGGSCGVECIFLNGSYLHAYCDGLTTSQVKEIMGNYSSDNKYIKLGERYVDDGMIYAFQSTDNNTIIYAQADDDDSCILYFSKSLAGEIYQQFLDLFN